MFSTYNIEFFVCLILCVSVALSSELENNITLATSNAGEHDSMPVSTENGGQTVTATADSKTAEQPSIHRRKDLYIEALEAINQKRKSHGMKPLGQSEQLLEQPIIKGQMDFILNTFEATNGNEDHGVEPLVKKEKSTEQPKINGLRDSFLESLETIIQKGKDNGVYPFVHNAEIAEQPKSKIERDISFEAINPNEDQSMKSLDQNGNLPEQPEMIAQLAFSLEAIEDIKQNRKSRGMKPLVQNEKTAEQPKMKSQKDYSLEAIEAINQKRKNHGVKPLLRNKRLQTLALKMAKELAKKNDINARIPVLRYVGSSVYYESFKTPIVELNGNNPIEILYMKYKSYDYSSEPQLKPGYPLQSGHFSQMVWKDTTDVGIAYALIDNKKGAFVVILYSPMGNLRGKYTEQVLPLIENSEDYEEVAPSTQSDKEEDFEQVFIKAHNEYRKLQQLMNKNIEQEKIKYQKVFSVEALEAINQKRRNHAVNPLVLNEKFQRVALKMAKKLVQKKYYNVKVTIPKNTGIGIYYKTSDTPIVELHGKDSIGYWYKEFENRDFSSDLTADESLDSGRFSQMLWKYTTDMGIAYAIGDDKKIASVVILFAPRSNLLGKFMKRVLPLNENAAEDEEVAFPSQSDQKDFEQLVLKAHNDYRKLHQVQPLKLNDKLNSRSQQWANELAKKDMMVHSYNDNNGENIYSWWSSDPTAKPKAHNAVDSWYNEIKFYNFNGAKFDQRTGHFTQVVWKGSTDLGVGIAQSEKSKKYYVVAKYKPAGNYFNKFKLNVLPKN